jgi:hypothetical protein
VLLADVAQWFAAEVLTMLSVFGPLALVQLTARSGFLIAMLQVITSNGVPVEVMTQAAIQFKNIVAKGWANMPGYPSDWTEDEKRPVRECVIEVCVIARCNTRTFRAACRATE